MISPRARNVCRSRRKSSENPQTDQKNPLRVSTGIQLARAFSIPCPLRASAAASAALSIPRAAPSARGDIPTPRDPRAIPARSRTPRIDRGGDRRRRPHRDTRRVRSAPNRAIARAAAASSSPPSTRIPHVLDANPAPFRDRRAYQSLGQHPERFHPAEEVKRVFGL